MSQKERAGIGLLLADSINKVTLTRGFVRCTTPFTLCEKGELAPNTE